MCEPCDDCYNLVSEAANSHRENLAQLDNMLKQIADNPQPVGQDFQYKLKELSVNVKSVLADAKISSQNSDGETLRDRLEELRMKLDEVKDLVTDSDSKIEVAKDHGVKASENFEKAKQVIDNARNSLKVSVSQFMYRKLCKLN